VYSTRTWSELVVGWGTVAAGLLLLGFPALASVASAQDNLMFKDTHFISLPQREALDVVANATLPDAVILASPNEPFAVPFFTGRSLLRTNYWLSPDDRLLDEVNAAFGGNKAAQEQVLAQADYLFLTKDQRTLWEPLPLKKLYDTKDVVIYQVK